MELVNEWSVEKTAIDGCLFVTGKRLSDQRGDFTEAYRDGVVRGFVCKQSNVAVNRNRGFNKAILRGIHRSPYQKLVCCPSGQVYDVCVDLRPGSPTYGEWHGTWLYASRMLLIPAYCGHAYMTKEATVVYYLDEVWQPGLDVDINAFDKQFNIWWPVSDQTEFIMSDKDRNAPMLKDIDIGF